MLKRSEGRIIDSYDEVFEYVIDDEGNISMRTLTIEIRQFENVKWPHAYLTYSNGRVYVMQLRDGATPFDIPDKPKGLFRFISDNDIENRNRIKTELERRIALYDEKIEDLNRKANRLRKAVVNLST